MEEILYLEPDEEITSVIDKLKKVKAQSIGLVVPREATLLQSVINLRLLSKEAHFLNKEIAIVTADKIGRNLANQVGLTVYGSLKDETPLFRAKESLNPNINTSEVIELEDRSEHRSTKGVKVHHFQDGYGIKPSPTQQKALDDLKVEDEPEIERVEKDLENEAEVMPNFEQKSVYNKTVEMTRINVSRDLGSKTHKGAKRIIWMILAAILILIGSVSFLLLPRAEVVVSVLAKDLSQNTQLVISQEIEKPDTLKKVFPGTLVKVTRETKEKFSTTGQKNIGEKASANILLYNSWDSSPRVFAAGTKFTSSSKTFLASTAFTIPGTAIKEGNLVPGTVNIKVEAEKPGAEYNIKAGRFAIVGLPAAQQEKIYGVAQADLIGGISKQVQVVSKEDYENAKKKLIDSLTNDLATELKSKAQGREIIEKSVNSIEPEIISSAKIDEESKEFEMSVKVEAQAMAIDRDGLKDYLVEGLSDQVPADKMVAIANNEDIVLSVSKLAYDEGEIQMDVKVNAKIAPRISEQKIREGAVGKSIGVVRENLLNIEDIENVEVTVSPSWWVGRMPDLIQNIKVKINYKTDQE